LLRRAGGGNYADAHGVRRRWRQPDKSAADDPGSERIVLSKCWNSGGGSSGACANTDRNGYRGMYGFAPAGQQLFFTPLDQQSAWTPAADQNTVYAYFGSRLTLVDPLTGQLKGSMVDPTFTNYIYVVGGSVVLGAENSAFAAAYDNSWLNGGGIGNSLIHFNTQALTVDWQSAGDYRPLPLTTLGCSTP
jgi:hypothetical protein